MRHKFGISVPQFDPDGAAVLTLSSLPAVRSGRRRQQITATLDGFVTSFDNGFTFAGNDLRLIVPYTESARQTLDHLLQNYAQVYLSTRQGFFRAAPIDWKISKNQIEFTTKILQEIALWP